MSSLREEQHRAEGQRSDEVRSLLHVVLLVLLHPPADDQEKQRAQCLVAHLQAQVPVGQEDTGLVRGRGSSVTLAPGPLPPGRAVSFSQQPMQCVITVQVRICHHPSGDHFFHSFNPQGHKPPGTLVGRGVGLLIQRSSSLHWRPQKPKATLQPQPGLRVLSSQQARGKGAPSCCPLGPPHSWPSVMLPHHSQTPFGPLKPTLPTVSCLCDEDSR